MNRVPPVSTSFPQSDSSGYNDDSQHPSEQDTEQLVMGVSEMVLQSPTEKKSSKLSAEAQEFVPSWMKTQTPSSVRLPVMASNVAAMATAIPPNQFAVVDGCGDGAAPQNPVQPEDISQYLLADIRLYMAHLQTSPASFSDDAFLILDLLISYAYNDEILSAAVDVIFSSGLEDANFTYQCGRLCAYLAGNYWGYGGNCAPVDPSGAQQQQPTETFQHLLINRCQQEHQKRLAGPLPCLYNYGLLLADLYNQLKVGNRNLMALGDAVLEVAAALLREPNNGNVAGAVSILKCCGATLEREETTTSGGGNGQQSPKLDAIFTKFESLLSHQSAATEYGLSEDGKTLIKNLLKNRADWKQYSSTQSSSGDGCQQESLDRVSGDMVYFGPDGMELTAEETAFLEKELGALQGSNSGDDEASLAGMGSGGSEDDAIDEAYEQFLRMTEEKRKQQNIPK